MCNYITGHNTWQSKFCEACVFCTLAGIVIVGEDTVGHFDLGIFVASIVPNGPADRDGRIKPGTG